MHPIDIHPRSICDHRVATCLPIPLDLHPFTANTVPSKNKLPLCL